jgi:hypothetical protein
MWQAQSESIVEVLLETIVSKCNGWSAASGTEFPGIDLVCNNAERELWLINIVEYRGSESEFQKCMRDAIARLILMMHHDFTVNRFGLAERNKDADPALVRYGLAIPDSSACIAFAAKIPNRIRTLTQMAIILVSQNGSKLFLPSVPLTKEA